jgi:DDE_Tnp_1-associated/Transposase DDE domain
VPPLSLVEALATVPDPRSCRGRRFPLVPVLSLVTLGLLLGHNSLTAILEIPQNSGTNLLLALGFPRLRAPSLTQLRRLLAALDVDALEAALARWIQGRLPEGGASLSLDGKTLRGSRDGEIPGHHLVSAYAPHAASVLGQLRVDGKTNEHKAALQLLGILPLPGKIVIGDAMFCQRDLAEKIVDSGGDYLFTAKDNQPGLALDVAAGFGFEAAARSIAAAFSPGGAAAAEPDGPDGGEGAWAAGTADAADDVDLDPARQVERAQAGI